MSKTLDDVKQALEGLDGGIELYEAVSNAILTEKNLGISKVNEANRQARAVKDALKVLGYDATQHNLDDYVADLKTRLETGNKSKEKLTDTEKRFLQLEKNNLDLTKNLDTVQTQLKSEKSKATDAVLREHLTKAFTNKIYSADVHAKELIRDGAVKLRDDNSVIFLDGENEIDFDAGIAKYFDKNKSSLINSQKGGSGGSPSSGDYSGKTMSRADYDKLNPFDAAKMVKDGVKLID